MEVIGWQSARSVSPLRCLGFLGFEFPWLTPWANFCRAAGAGDLYEYSFGGTPRAGRASSAPTKRGERARFIVPLHGRGQARKIWVSVLMMKRASLGEWPELRNCWRASSRVVANTEKITARLWRPMKWKRHSCWTSFRLADMAAGLALGLLEKGARLGRRPLHDRSIGSGNRSREN